MSITTVLFDLGGTLEITRNTQSDQADGAETIRRVLRAFSADYEMEPEVFRTRLIHHFGEYKRWSTESRVELKPGAIWGEWMLKEYPSGGRIADMLGETLCDLWESCYYRRELRKETPILLELLRAQGYRMGIISNTISPTLPSRLMKYYGIDQYFECMLLSAREGVRKPDASLFDKAARLMGAAAGECFYVGDQLLKDVAGSKSAGYGGSALLTGPLTEDDQAVSTYRINSLMQLPKILAEINK